MKRMDVELRFATWQIPVLVHTLRHLGRYYRELVDIWPHDEIANIYEDADGEFHYPEDYGELAEMLLGNDGVMEPHPLLLEVFDHLLADPHQSPKALSAWKDLRQTCYAALNGRVHLADWQWHIYKKAHNPSYQPPRVTLKLPLTPTPELSQWLHQRATDPNQSPQEREAWRMAYVQCNSLLLQAAPIAPQPPQ